MELISKANGMPDQDGRSSPTRQQSTDDRPARKKRPYVARVNHGGNFCNHQPDSPRLELIKPAKSKRRPGILIELQKRMRRYYEDPQVLPSLRNANSSKQGRQQRSERREACLVLKAAIIEHMDLVSLRCGIPTSKGFISLTLDYLIQFTGLHPRRAERAMKDLKKAGLNHQVVRMQNAFTRSWFATVAEQVGC